MWECPKCHEKHDDAYDTCWNCGVQKEGPANDSGDPDQKPGPSAMKSSSPPPLSPLVCEKCGSERVVPKASIWDQGQGSSGNLKAYVCSNPGALLFKGTTYATLYARICADCSHAEVFATGAEALYEAYSRSQEEKD
jgi:hypothetical protein